MNASLQPLLLGIIGAVFVAAFLASVLWLRWQPDASKSHYRLLGLAEVALALALAGFAFNDFQQGSGDGTGLFLVGLVIGLIEWKRRRLRQQMRMDTARHGT